MVACAIYKLAAGNQNPPVAYTAHRHQCFLIDNNVRPSIFHHRLNESLYQSQAASPSAPCDRFLQVGAGRMNCLQGSGSSVLRINGGLEQISARREQTWRWSCHIRCRKTIQRMWEEPCGSHCMEDLGSLSSSVTSSSTIETSLLDFVLLIPRLSCDISSTTRNPF
jgi:hypothetical protein